jgi:tetratricopeptide (TPR) repeat protein
MILGRASRAIATGAVLLMLAVTGPPGGAETLPGGTAVRSGSHSGFGRVVIDTTATTTFTLDQDSDHVVVHLPDDLSLGAPPSLPRNVVAITSLGPTLELVLRHGAQIRSWRLNGRIILDIMDEAAAPPAARPGQTAAQPPPRPPLSMASSPELGGRSTMTAAIEASAVPLPVATQPLPPPVPVQTLLPASPVQSAAPSPVTSPPVTSPPGTSSPGTSSPGTSGPPPAAVEATQQIPPGRDVLPATEGPLALRARRTRLPKEMDGTAFLVPFDTTSAAASFHSGNSTYVVFDERRPVDMAALTADPVFGTATVRLLQSGTVLRIPHPAALSIALTQLPQGWRIAALTTTPKQLPIVASATEGRLYLAAEQPGDVVNMADPDTGATLLVGTQHRPGQGIAPNRRSTEFILRRTFQGVVVEPLSDAIVLKQVPTGFSLTGAQAGLALSPATSATAALMDAANLTRRLNLSGMPADALLRLSVKQLGEAAGTPPLARGPRHHAAAETFMALGLAAEAETLLHMAADEDPKEAASPDTMLLTAVAALLAGRPDEAAALADHGLDGTDEITLWRAMRQAMQDEGSPAAAAAFAVTAPLALQYPKPIREHILPLMAETMIQGGEIEPAARLLSQIKNTPRLAYASALLRQGEGDTGQALTMLDALAAGRDQFDRARAAVRAVELRLATGALDKVQAADALDKLLYAWRGDARELKLRERVADLRGQTGAWRVALAMLRQAEADFPEQASQIHQRLKDMFVGMIGDQGTQQVPAIEFVATVGENADLMPESGDDAVEQSLADRLLALDLPGRAKPVLEKLTKQAKPSATKVRFATSLAMLNAREGDDNGVLAALNESQAVDLPLELAEQRLILRAEAVARQGDPVGGAALLTPLRTVRTTEARAQILETASDWKGATQAWTDRTALTVPNSGQLDEPQTRLVLRLATAVARAGDDAALAGLRETYGSRIAAGPLGDMFRLLTLQPIRTTADIGRSQGDISLAASLPAGLKALRTGAVTR